MIEKTVKDGRKLRKMSTRVQMWTRLHYLAAVNSAGRIRQVGDAFNRFLVPFRFKLLNQSGFYDRADAAVLYISRRHFRIASELLSQLYPRLGPGLDSETPLFTKHLAAGLAMAEDPGTGESFGMSRCRLMAEAIVDAHRQGKQSVEARLQATENRFRDAGLNFAVPYLNPSSNDEYVWPKN